MKKSKTKEKKSSVRGVTRREFVGTTALAAAGVMTGAPAILRGRDLNGKLDIAFIACGGRARASLGDSPEKLVGRVGLLKRHQVSEPLRSWEDL